MNQGSILQCVAIFTDRPPKPWMNRPFWGENGKWSNGGPMAGAEEDSFSEAHLGWGSSDLPDTHLRRHRGLSPVGGQRDPGRVHGHLAVCRQEEGTSGTCLLQLLWGIWGSRQKSQPVNRTVKYIVLIAGVTTHWIWGPWMNFNHCICAVITHASLQYESYFVLYIY